MNLPDSSNINRVQLTNGITVLVYENFNAQSVVISGSLHAGSLYEDREKNGVAALTASSLMRGTLHHDFDSIHTRLEVVGADAGVSGGMHRVGFSGKALAEDLPLLLDVLSDALRYPAFPIDQVERLKGEILTGLQYRQQDTRFLAGQAFRENLYPSEHPYYLSARGTLTTIPNITADDLRAFHAGHYGPQDMKVCIVGAVRVAEAVELVQRYFGDWENPQQPAIAQLPVITPFNEVRRQDITVPGKSQSDLIMGVVGPSRLATDYYAALIANSILGQFGMMGRIGAAVREESGMAYYASSRLEGGYGPGAWLISAGVNPANVEKALALCQHEIQRITTELVDAVDLADVQANFTGRLPLGLASNEGIAGSIMSMEVYNLGLDYLRHYHDLIYSITAEDVLQAVQHYWQPEAYVAVVAGPA